MMNPLLPIIEQLAEAIDDAARARWLLACPLAILITYSMTIRNRLHCAGFVAGIDYLECELVLARAVRKSGLVTHDNPLRLQMLAIAGFRAVEATEL